MTHLLRLSRLIVVALVVAGGLAVTAQDAFATHFRYGTMTWSTPNPAQPNIVVVRFDAAFRWSFPWGHNSVNACTFTPPSPNTVGTGSCPALNAVLGANGSIGNITSSVPVSVNGGPSTTAFPINNFVVTSISPSEDWMTGTFQFTLNLGSSTNVELVFQNCCRISSLQGNNSDRDYILRTGITVRNPINRPPVSASLPVIRVPFNTNAQFLLPAFDADGHAMTFRISTAAESGLVTPAPPGLSIHPTTGQVSWLTVPSQGIVLGALYATQFRISDSVGATTVVDVMLTPVNAVGPPPTVRVNGVAADAVFNVVRNNPISFNVSATSANATPITLQSSGLPIGAAMSPSLPTQSVSGNVSSTFAWTPTGNQVGSFVINYSAIDGNGQPGTRVATINVTNNPPTGTCSASGTTIEATSPGGAPFSLIYDVADLDDDLLTTQLRIGGTLVQSFTGINPPASRSFGPTMLGLGTHTYELRVLDPFSNVVVCSGSVSIVDTTAPTLSLPNDVTLDGSGPAGATYVFDPAPSATDIVSGTVPVLCSRTSGSAFFYGTTLVTCTATDAAGNEASGQFTVTVNDPTPPAVSYAIAGTLGNNGWYTSDAVVTWTVDEPDSGLSSTSGCDPTVLNTDTDVLGVTFTCAAANNRGGSTDVTTTAIKRDATPPSVAFTVASIVAEATSAAGAAVTFDTATISDALSGIATSSCTHSSGATFGLGTTEVRCDATDNAGNSAFAVLSITVQDTTAPMIVALLGGNIEATSPAGATLNFATPGATDAVDASVTVMCSPVTGSPVGFAPTTVTCTATDDAGNSASTSAVFAAVDTIAPVITSPGNQTATGNAPAGAAVSWAISATDAATATVVVTCTPASGSTFTYGDTTVTCAAPDDHGNTATASFTVTVNDLTPPSVTPTITGTLGANSWYTSDVMVSWAVSDPDSTISSSTGCTTTTTTTDGASFSFTCSATSAGGTTSQTVTFKRDATAPVVTPPANQSAGAESSAGADVDYPAATAQDAVSGVGAVTCTPASGSTFPIGTTTVTCSTTNGAGLAGSATFTVTVTDRTEPGKMYGQGDVRTADNHSLKFNFVVLESRRGFEWGDVDIKVKELRRRGGDIDRFDARTVDDVRFTNSPDYGPGRNSHTAVDTVQFSGTGKWEGRSGYRYVVNASDRGEPGRGRDTFTIQIVKISNGDVVFSGGGTLSDGNVQSTRLQKPWWWWTNHRDRDDDRGRGRGRGDR